MIIETQDEREHSTPAGVAPFSHNYRAINIQIRWIWD
jgi:hypothetical protein